MSGQQQSSAPARYCAVGLNSVENDGLELPVGDGLPTEDASSEDTTVSERTYRLYPQRHAVLFSFSVLTCVNSWMWITWSPIAAPVSRYWSVDPRNVDALSYVYMYVYILLSFPALYLLNRRGLRFGLLSGAALNLAGSVVRYAGTRSFNLIYVGTSVVAAAQTFTLAVPPLLAGKWFGADERGAATSLGVLANQFGTALGMGGTILMQLTIRNDDSAEMEIIDDGALRLYLGIQMTVSSIAMVLVGWFVDRDAPPTPPSEAAEVMNNMVGNVVVSDHFHDEDIITGNDEEILSSVKADQATDSEATLSGSDGTREIPTQSPNVSSSLSTPGYLESIYAILGNVSGVLFVVVYGLVVGVFYAVATFLSQFFVGEEGVGDNDVAPWTEKEAGYLGLSLVLVGLLGSLTSGYCMDRTHSYRRISIVLLAGSVIAMTSFLLSIHWCFEKRTIVFLATSCSGFFLTGFIGAGFEYGTALSYPSDEAAVAGVLNVSAQVGGWGLVYIGGMLPSVGLALNSVLVAVLSLSLLLLVFGVSARGHRPAH